MSEKQYIAKMPDGSEWAIPLRGIAQNQLNWCNDQDVDDLYSEIDEILKEYDSHPSAAKDWAQNNMNWDDVFMVAKLVKPPSLQVDYQEGWVNGEARIE